MAVKNRYAQVRGHCQELISALRMPRTCGTAEFADARGAAYRDQGAASATASPADLHGAVARLYRCRQYRLQPGLARARDQPGRACGRAPGPRALRQGAGQDADWIICRQDVPWRERMWFTAHQAAHMLLRHPGESVSCGEFAELLFPGLDFALSRDGGTTAMTFSFATPGEEYQALAVTMEVIGAAGTYHTSRSARNSVIA
jgi:hypothetical protein